MPVFAVQNGFGPAFLHRMLRLVKGIAKPNTGCWLARILLEINWVVRNLKMNPSVRWKGYSQYGTAAAVKQVMVLWQMSDLDMHTLDLGLQDLALGAQKWTLSSPKKKYLYWWDVHTTSWVDLCTSQTAWVVGRFETAIF
jgi:hypothetical protein